MLVPRPALRTVTGNDPSIRTLLGFPGDFSVPPVLCPSPLAQECGVEMMPSGMGALTLRAAQSTWQYDCLPQSGGCGIGWRMWRIALPQPWNSARWKAEWVWVVKIEGAAERMVHGPQDGDR